MEMKKIEVNLGIGINMFFPESVVIEIPSNYEKVKKSYERYLEFCKTLHEPDYDYLMDDPNEYKLREFTFDEFFEIWENNESFQKKFGEEEPKKRGRKPKTVKKEIEIEKE